MRRFLPFLSALLICSSVAVIFGCASGQPKKDAVRYQPNVSPYHVPYYRGDGGMFIHLAVLQPESVDLTENEFYLPGYIQSVLITDLSRYSAMTVTARQKNDAALAASRLRAGEGEALFESAVSDMDAVFGADHILSGIIRKTSATQYLLQLSLTDVSSGIVKAAYSKEILAISLRDSSALHEAALELLTRLGIELTAEGKESILVINPEEREGAVALAKGLMAEQSGNQIEAMSYLFSAVSYDASLREAVDRLEVYNRNFTGGLGDHILNDIEARSFWQKMINDFEAFYASHPPFELVFTPAPTQKGNTNYQAKTVNLKFDILFRESPELDGMRQVLKILMDGLARTGKKEEWGFGRWPYSANLFGRKRNFVYMVELLNDNNSSLQTIRFTTTGRLLAYRTGIYPDTSPKQELVFANVDADSLTSNPRVRMISVDGIDAEQSGIDGYIKFLPVDKLPSAYTKNLLVILTRNPFEK